MLLIYLFLLYFTCYAYKLNNYQLIKIQKILQHPELTPEIKKDVHDILINSYDKWLHKKVHTFAGKNKFSSEFKKELYESAKLGLLKCLKKYDGTSPLHVYADKYVFYEFTKSITNQMPLGYLNHYERYIKKVNITQPTFIGDSGIEEYYSSTKPSGPILCRTIYGDVVNVIEAKNNITRLISYLSEEEQHLFYCKYDKNTLQAKKNKEAYLLSNFSYERYCYKMKKINKYLELHLFGK